MCQYATLYAHSKRLGIPAVIDPKMQELLAPSFPNISIPSFSTTCTWNWVHWHWSNFDKLTVEDFKTKNIMLYKWNLNVGQFKFYKHQLITEEFAFHSSMISDVQDFFQSVVEKININKEIIFVGVHVRRNDFKDWMKSEGHGFVASQKYYLIAIEYYRNKYNSFNSTAVFIMASDDDQWCRKMFGNMSDVVFTSSSTTLLSKQQPTYDLAVLSHCNHSILR